MDFETFIDNLQDEQAKDFILAYDSWIKNQLRKGALIFPIEDYYYLWKEGV